MLLPPPVNLMAYKGSSAPLAGPIAFPPIVSLGHLCSFADVDFTMRTSDAAQSLSTIVADRWITVSTAGLVIVASLWVPSLIAQFRTWQIPVVGEELGSAEKRRQAYLSGARALYNEGYRKVRYLEAVISTKLTQSSSGGVFLE